MVEKRYERYKKKVEACFAIKKNAYVKNKKKEGHKYILKPTEIELGKQYLFEYLPQYSLYGTVIEYARQKNQPKGWIAWNVRIDKLLNGKIRFKRGMTVSLGLNVFSRFNGLHIYRI